MSSEDTVYCVSINYFLFIRNVVYIIRVKAFSKHGFYTVIELLLLVLPYQCYLE